LLVGNIERFEDAPFLAEVLGNRDAADRLLDGRVDVRHGLHAALGHAPRHGTEAQRNQEDDRDEGKQQHGHAPLGAHQDDAQDQRLEHLRGHVGDDDHQLAEVVGVGSDTRDDAAGGELVVERKVMFGGSMEGLGAQFQHHIPDRASDQRAPRPVQPPNADRHNQHGDADISDQIKRRLVPAIALPRRRDHVHGPRNHHRQRRADDGIATTNAETAARRFTCGLKYSAIRPASWRSEYCRSYFSAFSPPKKPM
jgi:hypothetical protein